MPKGIAICNHSPCLACIKQAQIIMTATIVHVPSYKFKNYLYSSSLFFQNSIARFDPGSIKMQWSNNHEVMAITITPRLLVITSYKFLRIRRNTYKEFVDKFWLYSPLSFTSFCCFFVGFNLFVPQNLRDICWKIYTRALKFLCFLKLKSVWRKVSRVQLQVWLLSWL